MNAREYEPVLKEAFARSASCSSPKGATKGDLELRVAAMVRAGSRHLKSAATNRNLPEEGQGQMGSEEGIDDLPA